MNWIVWRITAKNFTEEARFHMKAMADAYAENMNKIHTSIRFEVTKAGETPVW